MNTDPYEITIRDLIKDYTDDSGDGGAVVGLGGKLNIRPAYQREFIYDRPQQEAVIHSIANGFPLNVMYWADDGASNYEILDGQQRTLSICKFYANEFSSDAFSSGSREFFGNLPDDEREKFLDYELMVYRCIGDDSDKLKWFKTINIAGEQLTPQELKNAIYACPWVTDARRLFSNKNAMATEYGGKYLNGSALRQEYLEQAIAWHADGKDKIADYMSLRKKNKDKSAQALWDYFESIFVWVEQVFPEHHKEMHGLDWGRLHKEHKDGQFDAQNFAKRIKVLRADEDVKNSGIYEYLLTDDIKHITVRNFDNKLKQRIYKKQKGICAWRKCANPKKKFKLDEMEADHIKPWKEGGPSNEDNCQMLCKDCNRRKGGR